MLYVSPIVEGLRAQPRLVFRVAAFAQAALWTLVPALFYAAPPGDLPQMLAVGHEWQAGSDFGPPLSMWLAEAAFALAGGHVFGVYLLAQACVLVTFWAVFTLGSAIAGGRHAAMAVLLMTGIVVFSFPTPEFGPAVAGMPLGALALLHLWRALDHDEFGLKQPKLMNVDAVRKPLHTFRHHALGEKRARYWFALGVDLGLMMLATYAGFIFLAAVALFLAMTARGRASLREAEPWAGLMAAAFIASPHLIWLVHAAAAGQSGWPAMALQNMASLRLADWLQLLAIFLCAHVGLVAFVIIAARKAKGEADVPVIERQPAEGFGKAFVYFFAAVPAVLGAVCAIVFDRPGSVWDIAPLIVMSGLAVVLAAGDAIRLHRERLLAWTWVILLFAPPAIMVAAIVLLPWTVGIGLRVSEPAAEMAQFFNDSFSRRTGRPLAVVGGDARIATLVALAARDRPSVLFDGSRERSPWIGEKDIEEKGAVILWPAVDTVGGPPAEIRARFPNLVPEMPRAFARAVEGRAPLLRIGWAVIRPAAARKGP